MTDKPIRVAVAGAKGRMGREVVKMLVQEPDFSFVVGIDAHLDGVDVGTTNGLGELGVPFVRDLERALDTYRPDVLVDFTTPEVVRRHVEAALDRGVRPVVGTTGLSETDVEELARHAEMRGVGGVIAPNFAIGAVLMMKFAQMAAKYLPHVEIIELHHDQKLDAPSGTALKTAEGIQRVRAEFRQGHPDEKELVEGARGAYVGGFRIHSVRLPGLIAHQEVLFGGEGQLLTIRHDALSRACFMPGVALAIRRVMTLDRLVYGLEHLLD
ncbi:dihydrodipicolinate reductase [Calditerricola yamamurae]